MHQNNMLGDGCQFWRRDLFGNVWSWFTTTMHFALPSYTSYVLPALHNTEVTEISNLMILVYQSNFLFEI